MNWLTIGISVCALAGAVALLAAAGRQRVRAESAAREADVRADRAAARDLRAELEEALADAQLVRGLALRCYPTGDAGDTVTLGPVHYLPSEDGSGDRWYIHVLVPQTTSYLLAEAASIWQQESRPTAALLNFLTPTTLSATAEAATAASAGEEDR